MKLADWGGRVDDLLKPVDSLYIFCIEGDGNGAWCTATKGATIWDLLYLYFSCEGSDVCGFGLCAIGNGGTTVQNPGASCVAGEGTGTGTGACMFESTFFVKFLGVLVLVGGGCEVGSVET